MGRWTQFTSASGSPTRCRDNATGIDYPPVPCPPNKVSRGSRGSKTRNFIDLASYTDKSTIVPVGIGAVAGGFAGKFAASKIKLGFLGKYNTPVMIVAGVVVGAMVGKAIANKMAASKVTVEIDPEAKTSTSDIPTTEGVTLSVV